MEFLLQLLMCVYKVPETKQVWVVDPFNCLSPLK